MHFSIHDPPQTISSVDDIRQWLNVMLLSLKLHPYVSYKFQKVRHLYIYCKCQQCSARLVYKKQDSHFRLWKCYSNHVHKDKWFRGSAIVNEIQSYPACYGTKALKNQITYKYKISASTFYRYLKQSKCSASSMPEVLTDLEQQGIFGVTLYLTDTDLPSLTILTSNTMITKYYACNKHVQFDLTYNLIREREGNSQYSVGAFVCVNQNFTIEPVCLVVMQSETTENFIKMFTQFFYLMKSPPNIIVTDQQKTIQYALRNLKQRQLFKGYHFFDIFHLLRNIKKQLEHKPSMNYIVSLIRSVNQIQFNNKYEICRLKLSERDFRMLSSYEQVLSSSCFALLPSDAFIGFSSSTNSCQKMNDLIKQKIPYSQNYCAVVNTISRFFAQMAQRKIEHAVDKIRIEQYLCLPELKELRCRVTKKLYKKLVMELSLALTCMISFDEENQNSYGIFQREMREQESFVVTFDDRAATWSCSCNYSTKSGIPCCHIIKVLLFRRQPIISAVNQWWLNTEVPSQVPKIAKPRKTRRNR